MAEKRIMELEGTSLKHPMLKNTEKLKEEEEKNDDPSTVGES